MLDDMYKKRFKAEKGKNVSLAIRSCGTVTLFQYRENTTLVSCLNVDATSHENLQQKQFPNDAVYHLMQYLLFAFLLSGLRRH